MTYYVIVTSDPRRARYVLRVLGRYAEVRVLAVAILAYTDKHYLVAAASNIRGITISRGYPVFLPQLKRA